MVQIRRVARDSRLRRDRGDGGEAGDPGQAHAPRLPSLRGVLGRLRGREVPSRLPRGDPEEFWSEEQTPQWAKARGWGYYRGDYPALEELYGEVENFLIRHPRVTVVFPHFLFLSPHMERLDDFFNRHPSANVDLTPGIELVYSISRRRDDWRRFFTRRADRILLGTDIGMSKTVEEHLARIWILRMFLETREEFYTPDSADELLTRYEEPFIGLDLPKAALEKICSGNFHQTLGSEAEERRRESRSGCVREEWARQASRRH